MVIIGDKKYRIIYAYSVSKGNTLYKAYVIIGRKNIACVAYTKNDVFDKNGYSFNMLCFK